MKDYNVSIEITGFFKLEAKSLKAAREKGNALVADSIEKIEALLGFPLEKGSYIEDVVNRTEYDDYDANFSIKGVCAVKAVSEEEALDQADAVVEAKIGKIEKFLHTGFADDSYAVEAVEAACAH